MADIRTYWINNAGQWQVSPPGLAEDDGLETAVIISLFTDRRAEPDDVLPDNSNDPRGWWADQFSDVDGDLIGSRLWLLSREKQLSDVLSRAQEYAEEALAWMVEDGVADSVAAQAVIVRDGLLGLTVQIFRPTGTPAKFRFELFWKGN
jgi:phage gp46-like protein